LRVDARQVPRLPRSAQSPANIASDAIKCSFTQQKRHVAAQLVHDLC
jgi:hypothetical protein